MFNADQPYLIFSELKPETHIFFFLPNVANVICFTETDGK